MEKSEKNTWDCDGEEAIPIKDEPRNPTRHAS